jgi:sarcosine oxidase subunit alpha
MMTSAIRAYVNRFAVTPGERIAIFTNNDDGWRTAGDLVAAGIDVATIIDSRTELPPEVKEKCPTARVVAAGEVVATSGRPLLRALTVRIPPGSEVIEADVLGVSGGWNPEVGLGGFTEA